MGPVTSARTAAGTPDNSRWATRAAPSHNAHFVTSCHVVTCGRSRAGCGLAESGLAGCAGVCQCGRADNGQLDKAGHAVTLVAAALVLVVPVASHFATRRRADSLTLRQVQRVVRPGTSPSLPFSLPYLTSYFSYSWLPTRPCTFFTIPRCLF